MVHLLRENAPIQTDSGAPEATPGPAPSADAEPAPPLNFRILAVLWSFVSAGAVFLVFRDPGWRMAPTVLSALGAVRIEQWVALLLIGVQVWLVIRARRRS